MQSATQDRIARHGLIAGLDALRDPEKAKAYYDVLVVPLEHELDRR